MRKRRLTAGLLALGISASLIFHTPVFAAEETQDTETQTEASGEGGSSITTNAIPGWPQGPDITSTAAIVMEDSTNTILYAKNMDQPLYPASAVKIMTILLALENANPEDQVVMTATGVSGVTDGGANISAQLDETFSVEQCLYAIMLQSANDIALQVAEHIGGSVEAFVEKMNSRAQELGCTNTVFTNPTGLPDENQHITAHDMALIMKAAMSNETFRKIAATTSYTIPATNVSGGERVLTNNFTMINNASDAYYQGCLGGKEGYTEASGSTLVCAAERNGVTLISVVLQGASGQTDDEAITTLDYGFNNFQKLTLGDDDFSLLSGGTVMVPAGSGGDSLTTEDTEDNGQILRQYLFGGTPVGTAVLENVQKQDNTAVVNGEANMKAAQDFSASRTNMPYYLIGAAGIVIFLLLLFAMVKVVKS
ncbi:MAG: D-alanyl-D-alanine carboxypeptidase family protein [Eubacteriales bacterium]|nr:D-alanyl-D-alanine carboxypeptidase family protein [Eubacteriales bacterium]